MVRRHRQRAIAVRSGLAPLAPQLSDRAFHVERVREKSAILQLFRQREIRVRLERRLVRLSGLYQRKGRAITRVGFRAEIVDAPCELADATALREHLRQRRSK